MQEIKKAVSLLSEQPAIGRVGRVPNTRELVVDKTPFILPYRVRDNKIEILHNKKNTNITLSHPNKEKLNNFTEYIINKKKFLYYLFK